MCRTCAWLLTAVRGGDLLAVPSQGPPVPFAPPGATALSGGGGGKKDACCVAVLHQGRLCPWMSPREGALFWGLTDRLGKCFPCSLRNPLEASSLCDPLGCQAGTECAAGQAIDLPCANFCMHSSSCKRGDILHISSCCC